MFALTPLSVELQLGIYIEDEVKGLKNKENILCDILLLK